MNPILTPRLTRQFLHLLAGFFFLVGCGGPNVELAKVEGRVLLEDKPLADAWVDFSPEFLGRASGARTDSTGTFKLSYAGDLQGALPGEYTVKIGTGGLPDPTVEKGITFTPRVELFEQRNVEVEFGSNSFEFQVPVTPAEHAKR